MQRVQRSCLPVASENPAAQPLQAHMADILAMMWECWSECLQGDASASQLHGTQVVKRVTSARVLLLIARMLLVC